MKSNFLKRVIAFLLWLGIWLFIGDYFESHLLGTGTLAPLFGWIWIPMSFIDPAENDQFGFTILAPFFIFWGMTSLILFYPKVVSLFRSEKG